MPSQRLATVQLDGPLKYRHVAEEIISPSGRARSSQEQPGTARNSQEEPGGARRGQEKPGGARRSQERPGEPGEPGEPGAPIGYRSPKGLLLALPGPRLAPPGSPWFPPGSSWPLGRARRSQEGPGARKTQADPGRPRKAAGFGTRQTRCTCATKKPARENGQWGSHPRHTRDKGQHPSPAAGKEARVEGEFALSQNGYGTSSLPCTLPPPLHRLALQHCLAQHLFAAQ